MEWVRMLREQAALLRTLAGSFDIRILRDRLLDIAAQCEELAKRIEENPQAAGLTPPDAPPDLR